MSLSRQCASEKCSRLSRALCNCCEKYLCLDHLKEHTDRINDQLTPLSDEFNRLSEELNKISLVETSFLKELDIWCFKAHKQIDHFYQQKRKEFEMFFQETKQKQEDELDRIRHQFQQIINQQEATKENIELLNNTLRSVQQQINSIRNQNFLLTPLTIDDNLILTPKPTTFTNVLPLSSPYQTLIRKETSWFSIATNEEHILICQASKLCLLNQQMKIKKEIPWLYDQIWDMFFSTSLNRFIIITQQEIFNLDGKTMILTKYPIFDNFHTDRQWYCGTSHNEILFLSTTSSSSSIYEYKMIPSIQFVKEWQSPLSCSNDEHIYDLRSNNHFLGIIILNETKDETRLELRSPTTFQRKWTIYITASAIHRIRCCPLLHNQWLINDAINSRLLHINEDGIIIKEDKYNSSPRHSVQLGKHLIVISTLKSFNLHRLS